MNRIKILGLNYDVEEVNHIPETTDTIGLFLSQEQKILIKKGIPKELKEQVLMHEIMHAIFWSIGEYEMAENEKLIQSLSSVLYQLLKENIIFPSS